MHADHLTTIAHPQSYFLKVIALHHTGWIGPGTFENGIKADDEDKGGGGIFENVISEDFLIKLLDHEKINASNNYCYHLI